MVCCCTVVALLPCQNPNGTFTYCGNDTECALLIMANQLGHPYEKIRQVYPENQAGRKGFSFSSDRKRMSTIVKVPCPSFLIIRFPLPYSTGVDPRAR